MTDLIDLAQQRDEEYREAALARARDRCRPRAGSSAPRDCVRCGEPIPPERLAAVAGVETCIDCQQHHERGAR